jgi:hypothetical protein
MIDSDELALKELLSQPNSRDGESQHSNGRELVTESFSLGERTDVQRKWKRERASPRESETSQELQRRDWEPTITGDSPTVKDSIFDATPKPSRTAGTSILPQEQKAIYGHPVADGANIQERQGQNVKESDLYSKTSSKVGPSDKGYINEFATDLLQDLHGLPLDGGSKDRVIGAMTDYLKASAFKFGHELKSPDALEAMVFIHRHNRHVRPIWKP